MTTTTPTIIESSFTEGFTVIRPDGTSRHYPACRWHSDDSAELALEITDGVISGLLVLEFGCRDEGFPIQCSRSFPAGSRVEVDPYEGDTEEVDLQPFVADFLTAHLPVQTEYL